MSLPPEKRAGALLKKFVRDSDVKSLKMSQEKKKKIKGSKDDNSASRDMTDGPESASKKRAHVVEKECDEEKHTPNKKPRQQQKKKTSISDEEHFSIGDESGKKAPKLKSRNKSLTSNGLSPIKKITEIKSEESGSESDEDLRKSKLNSYFKERKENKASESEDESDAGSVVQKASEYSNSDSEDEKARSQKSRVKLEEPKEPPA